MPAVESAHKRQYKLRNIAKAGLEAALRVLPDGYKRITRMLRHHAAYSWRDPDGRFHLIIVRAPNQDSRSHCDKCDRYAGQSSTVSFWADELRDMLKLPVLTISAFLP